MYTPNYGIEHTFNNAYPLLNLSCLPIGWVYPATITIPVLVQITTLVQLLNISGAAIGSMQVIAI